MGVLAQPGSAGEGDAAAPSPAAASVSSGMQAVDRVMAGKPCPECGNAAMIHKDGCEFCTACGFVGACG
jgi:ribonucleoside-diphosphate reductase alpha chain